MTASKFVADHSDTYQVKRLCEIVELERSSYYAWKSAEPARAARTEADAQRADRIRAIHAQDNTSGAPRITAELNDSVAADEKVNHKRAVWVGLTHRDRAP
ncbi:transposase [Rhodococcus pyridinivorans SB3094]|uniref:Transposase n=1 Tax=Rhodococcus pyridinivorans SB3094 TaxID=1435356 RepID=V9XMY0_9NOCA|nr:transposase [Rhodococcus pyridinivorans SB3094]